MCVAVVAAAALAGAVAASAVARAASAASRRPLSLLCTGVGTAIAPRAEILAARPQHTWGPPGAPMCFQGRWCDNSFTCLLDSVALF